MDAIILHPLGFQIDLFHKKGQQRNIKLFGQGRVQGAEGFIITTAIVRGQANLHQQRLSVGGFDILNHRPQSLLGLLGREAAQPVVAPQLDQHPARLMLFEQRRESCQSLLRGVAADAGVDDRRGGLPLIVE